MRAPEPRSSAVIPVPHCPDVTVPGVGYWALKVGGATESRKATSWRSSFPVFSDKSTVFTSFASRTGSVPGQVWQLGDIGRDATSNLLNICDRLSAISHSPPVAK